LCFSSHIKDHENSSRKAYSGNTLSGTARVMEVRRGSQNRKTSLKQDSVPCLGSKNRYSAQQCRENQGEDHHHGQGRHQPSSNRFSNETARGPDQRGRRLVQQRPGGKRRVGSGSKHPTTKASKRKGERHLERHGRVVRGIDNGQVEPQRESDNEAEGRWNSHHGNAADGKSQGKRQCKPPRRDAGSHPRFSFLPHRFERSAHLYPYAIGTKPTGGQMLLKLW
jgi:hypothetical protein